LNNKKRFLKKKDFKERFSDK
ncbi:hypothetical protein RRG08_017703, partial [Elysia crispata]